MMVKPGISTCRAYTPFRTENQWFAVYKLQLRSYQAIGSRSKLQIQCYSVLRTTIQLAKLLRSLREDPRYGSVTFEKNKYWTPALN